MTSIKQWRANRGNARRSTGPKSLNGKLRSRQNAVRHGLTAETVIGVLEDPEDYQAFEAAIIADFQPITTIEHELVVRLASILWRLRRAVAIESGILNIQGEILRDRKAALSRAEFGQLNYSARIPCDRNLGMSLRSPRPEPQANTRGIRETPLNPDVARTFLRIINLENDFFERLGRYEASLWRHFDKTLLLLEAIETTRDAVSNDTGIAATRDTTF
jgi:hypothetical protein